MPPSWIRNFRKSTNLPLRTMSTGRFRKSPVRPVRSGFAETSDILLLLAEIKKFPGMLLIFALARLPFSGMGRVSDNFFSLSALRCWYRGSRVCCSWSRNLASAILTSSSLDQLFVGMIAPNTNRMIKIRHRAR